MIPKLNIPKAFFSFLIASFFIWLLINLSKVYSTTLHYEVAYEKLPQEKVFEEKPLKQMDIQVEATGFKLLSANFHNKKLVFNLDRLRKFSSNKFYFLPKDQEANVQKQLYKGLRLTKLLKDSIFLKLGSLDSRKVPVIASLSINYEHGYDLAAPIEVTPDSILVSGPKLQLDKLNAITTENVTFNDVSKDITKILKIQRPKDLNELKLSKNKVDLKIKVDKFTEGEFLIPFTIDNLPKGIKINTYPKEIKVVFKVGLSNFNKISPNSFKVVCDYKVSLENDLPYLIPKLIIKPSLISSVRLMSSKIEFLTQK